jgi:hypothetical protein
MKRIGLAALVIVILGAGDVDAGPGDLVVVRGTLQWPTALAQNPFAVVRGDDGRHYYADTAVAQRASGDGLAAGRRVSLVGVEGRRPWEIRALVFGAGDSAMTTTAPGGPAAASEPDWDRVEGVVESASDRVVVLRAADGRDVKVDVSHLNHPRLLAKGNTVKAFGTSRSTRDFVATGVILY